MESMFASKTVVDTWFEHFVAEIRKEELLYNTELLPPERKAFYNACFEDNMDEAFQITKSNIIRRFTVQILQEYLSFVYNYKEKVRLMGVNLRDTELLIWAEINDDDDNTEGQLFIDEAKINAKFFDKQISISTTIVENSDFIAMPNQYLTLFTNA